MALILKNLALIGGPGCESISAGALVGAPKLWSYVTEDAHATVDSAGYFNAGTAYKGAYDLMEKGDVIFVVVAAASAVSTYGTHIVIDKASGQLDVSNVTVGTMTDSD
jgi:hypothetical protein